MQAPLGKHRGPIYMAVSAPRGAPFVPQRPQMGQLPLMQMGYDAAQLMAQEYRSMTVRRRLARIADLEAQLAADPMPGFDQVCFRNQRLGLHQLTCCLRTTLHMPCAQV